MRDVYAGLIVSLFVLAGLLIMTAAPAAAAGTTYVVNQSGSADYPAIQDALNATSDSDTVEVQPGTYTETLTVDTEITLVAPNGATLNGSSFGIDSTGIYVDRNVSTGLTIDGFTVERYGDGIGVGAAPDEGNSEDAGEFGSVRDGIAGGWTIQNVVVRDNAEDGIDIPSATDAAWTLTNVTATGNGDEGIEVGNFATSNVDWVIDGANASDNGAYGIRIGQQMGAWTIRDSVTNDNGDSSEDGIEVTNSGSGWLITNHTAMNNDFSGISVPNGDAGVVEQANLSENLKFGFAAGTEGNWTLRDSLVLNNNEDGVYDSNTPSSFLIDNVTISGNGHDGVFLLDNSGDWQILDSVIENNGATDSADLPGAGIDAERTSGSWIVNNTSITGNSDAGIYALDGPSPFGDATDNWWGQSTGPLSGQCVGNVTCNPYLESDPGVSSPATADIQGRVYDSSESPLSGIDVTVYRYNGSHFVPAATTTTQFYGTYNVSDIDASGGSVDLKLKFASSSNDYATQWYGGNESQSTATVVTVNEGATRSYLNAYLAPPDTAPTIESYTFSVIDTKETYLSLTTDEALSSAAIDIENESGTVVETLDLTDIGPAFTTGTSYIYGYSYTPTETGTYSAILRNATNSAGNDAGSDQLRQATVYTNSTRVRILSGPGSIGSIDSNVYVTGGLLQVQLRDSDDSGESIQNRTELSDLGVNATTEFEINATIDGYEPRLLLGTGRNISWSTTANPDGTTNVSIRVTPGDLQLISSRLSATNPGPWPTDGNDQADESYTAVVDLAIDEMSFISAQSTRNAYNGTVLATDAQEFGSPQVTTTESGDPQLSLDVSGPHLTASGDENVGYFDAFLPSTLLTEWGVADPSNLAVEAIGESVQPATQQSAQGIRLTLTPHYSSGSVDIAASSSEGEETGDSGEESSSGSTGGGSSGSDDSTDDDATTVTAEEQTVSEDDETADELAEDESADTSNQPEDTVRVSSASASVRGGSTLEITHPPINDGSELVDTEESTGEGEESTGEGEESADEPTDDGTDQPTNDGATDGDATGLGATGREAAADDPNRPPPPPVSQAEIERVEIDVREDVDAEVEIRQSRSPPSNDASEFRRDDGTQAAGYIQVTDNLEDDQVTEGRITFRVRKADLETDAADPENVALYHYVPETDEWEELDTEILGETDDYVRFRGTTPGFSQFAAGIKRAQFEISDTLVDVQQITLNDSIQVEAIVTNTGGADGTFTTQLLVDSEVVAEDVLTIASGGQRATIFDHEFEQADTYQVRVNDVLTGEIQVTDPNAATESTADSLPGFGVGAAVASLFVTILLFARRSDV